MVNAARFSEGSCLIDRMAYRRGEGLPFAVFFCPRGRRVPRRGTWFFQLGIGVFLKGGVA